MIFIVQYTHQQVRDPVAVLVDRLLTAVTGQTQALDILAEVQHPVRN
jgi:hypothetical protein